MTTNTVTRIPILVNRAEAALVEFEDAINSAIYASYRFQRDNSPHIPAEQWTLIFGDVSQMEACYQVEKLDALYEARRGVFPLTYAEIKAIGPAAVKEWSQRQIDRALALHREK